jgi:hypothetical protein
MVNGGYCLVTELAVTETVVIMANVVKSADH